MWTDHFRFVCGILLRNTENHKSEEYFFRLSGFLKIFARLSVPGFAKVGMPKSLGSGGLVDYFESYVWKYKIF